MDKIKICGIRSHSKASEKYVDVVFHYPNGICVKTSVPIQYRRTGLDIPENDSNKMHEYLENVYKEINPAKWKNWKKEQGAFWKGTKADVTKPFFDKLAEDFKYKCVNCELPQNPNWARRVQDLKECGYTIATKLSEFCPKCKKTTTHLVLVPLKRGGITGYETWSPKLRARIVNLLKRYDAFEAKQTKKEGLLPDHKFSEIRWDNSTKRENLENLTDEEILRDFQLISNQRNQQKREVCRKCFQTGERGIIYGIPFFYEGTEKWNPSIPKTGKEAEKGRIGCGWYDIERWRKELIKKLSK